MKASYDPKLLLDPRWDAKRKSVLSAHHFTCDNCQARRCELHVHHGYYLRDRAPWDYPDSALHVLCSRCHTEIHQPVTHTALDLIEGLSSHMTLQQPPKDPRSWWWEDAQTIAKHPDEARSLMAIAGWLTKRGYGERPIIQRVMQIVAQSNLANPYAYFAPGGKALEAIVGELAVLRAEAQQQLLHAQDAAYLHPKPAHSP